MKFVCISDTHCKHDHIEVPEGDVLIHAGDSTGRGSFDDLKNFGEFLSRMSHRYKVVISGNHDFCFQTDRSASKAVLGEAIYLQDSGIEIEGLKIYGSPWQPWFFDWAFNLQRGPEIKKVWDKIPENTDILITHGPPMGILDKTRGGDHAGCEELLKAIKRINPSYHIFGHIHEGYGVYERGATTFINASTCDVGYQPINPPIVFDI